MKIKRKRFCDWNRRMKRRLRYATFRGGYLCRFARAFPASQTIVIFSPKGQVMGWAFAHNHGNAPTDLNLFINLRYRKRGLGTTLIEESLIDFPKIRLAEWDTSTKNLFRKMKKQYPDKITVFDWWANRERYDNLLRSA